MDLLYNKLYNKSTTNRIYVEFEHNTAKPLQGRDNDTKRRAVYLRQLTFLLVNISVIISIIVVKVIAHNDAYLC